MKLQVTIAIMMFYKSCSLKRSMTISSFGNTLLRRNLCYLSCCLGNIANQNTIVKAVVNVDLVQKTRKSAWTPVCQILLTVSRRDWKMFPILKKFAVK